MAKRILTAPNYVTNTIQSLANVVKGQASALKAAFDQIATDAKDYDTYLRDEMQATTGAYTLGFDGAQDNVGDALSNAISEIATRDTDISNLQSDVSDLQTDIGALGTEMDAVEAAILALQNSALAKIEGTITIPTTGWVAHAGDNALKLDLAISGILATDDINMEIDEEYQDVATVAAINPTVNEYADGVTLYADTAPTEDIPVKWWVIR